MSDLAGPEAAADEEGPSHPELLGALRSGTLLARWAASDPRASVIVTRERAVSRGELNGLANRMARCFRALELRAGDAVALLAGPRPEAVAVVAACQRAGLRLTPLNAELEPVDLRHVIAACGARLLVADAGLGEVVARCRAAIEKVDIRLALGGGLPGFERLDGLLERYECRDLEDPVAGDFALFSSGVTDTPHGVIRKREDFERWIDVVSHLFDASLGSRLASAREKAWSEIAVRLVLPSPLHRSDEVHLCVGRLFQTQSFWMQLVPALNNGSKLVVAERAGAEEILRAIEQHRVTDLVASPEALRRLLRLPERVRRTFDVSSLRFVLHGGAPIAVPTKRAILDWLGPIVHEYYAGVEGLYTVCNAEQWLSRPGTVGLGLMEDWIQIRDDAGHALGPDTIGKIFVRESAFRPGDVLEPDGRLPRARADGEYYHVGDTGYLDRDGFLFLVGRASEVILSDGLSVWPEEVDAVMRQHAAVDDAATVARPGNARNEVVWTVVKPMPGVPPTRELAEELAQFCRERLAGYKCPRGIDFVLDLPRLESGRLCRRRVRDRYWEDRGRPTRAS